MVNQGSKYDDRYMAVVEIANEGSFNLAELQAWASKTKNGLSFDWMNKEGVLPEQRFQSFNGLPWTMEQRLRLLNPHIYPNPFDGSEAEFSRLLLCAIFDGELSLYRNDILTKIDVEGARRKYEQSSIQNQIRDNSHPLESAALDIANQKWPDTAANRTLAEELWWSKYPNQKPPLLNGEVCRRGYLAYVRRETEIEIQDAINNLLFDDLLTLFSSNTKKPTNSKSGACISQNELFKLMNDKLHLKKNIRYYEKLFNGRRSENWPGL